MYGCPRPTSNPHVLIHEPRHRLLLTPYFLPLLSVFFPNVELYGALIFSQFGSFSNLLLITIKGLFISKTLNSSHSLKAVLLLIGTTQLPVSLWHRGITHRARIPPSSLLLHSPSPHSPIAPLFAMVGWLLAPPLTLPHPPMGRPIILHCWAPDWASAPAFLASGAQVSSVSTSAPEKRRAPSPLPSHPPTGSCFVIVPQLPAQWTNKETVSWIYFVDTGTHSQFLVASSSTKLWMTLRVIAFKQRGEVGLLADLLLCFSGRRSNFVQPLVLISAITSSTPWPTVKMLPGGGHKNKSIRPRLP